jgi:uncharacterized membrane protein
MATAGANDRRGGSWRLWLVFGGAWAIGLASFRYLIPGAPGAAPPILANGFTHLGVLTVHAGFAATALILGPLQFLGTLRRRRPLVHRWIGRAYGACCLVGGLAGLILAFGARTGPVSAAGFGTLAMLWLATTAMGWLAARDRRFAEHRRWMIRSYALTFAAVTLRLYLPFAFILPTGYDDTYRAISFLCWVPNLIVAELWLRRDARLPSSAASV